MSDESLQNIDEIIAAFFSVFDNRAQAVPDMSKLKPMFLPDAIITKCSGGQIETMSLLDFVTPRDALFKSGTLKDFHEWEVSSNTVVNGTTATRICKYEKEGLLCGERFSGEGTKSIQMVLTQQGWKIISVLWEDLE